MLPGREPGQPRWEASDLPLDLRHGHLRYHNQVCHFEGIHFIAICVFICLVTMAIFNLMVEECVAGQLMTLSHCLINIDMNVQYF
jgi:hypothetical protein